MLIQVSCYWVGKLLKVSRVIFLLESILGCFRYLLSNKLRSKKTVSKQPELS